MSRNASVHETPRWEPSRSLSKSSAGNSFPNGKRLLHWSVAFPGHQFADIPTLRKLVLLGRRLNQWFASLRANDELLPNSVLQLPDLELANGLFETALVSPMHDMTIGSHRPMRDWYCSRPRLAFNGVVVFRVKVNF
jgi:hypothetical protein